ncbi:MAG: Response regulator rcp1 [Candidatus Accumulibacter adjunctus]|uniref:Response regulator rcp1 n=1 Tax=Candidatus Accumulibacter adjunctus TaxID=1454001 RepID=A0A011NPI8_9PROT|nr:MAG: Response regulator rcp1 [Candidatus Accumulibacter adjunctus]
MTAIVARGEGGGGSAARLLILLVEDEPADAHLLRVALSESRVDAEVEHVVDGREALEYLRRQGGRFLLARRPDLILLDLNMPRMDGREFLAEVRDDQSLRSIPVVVLSTSAVERDVLAAHRLGAAGYIVKTADVGAFIDEIRRLAEHWSHEAILAHNGKRTAAAVDATETRK